ncbi:MAG: tRNA pseudouridine(38-40) synthase TruA [Alphaproteobacteria bacterium]
MKRWKLTIEYDGTHFCGWQRQAHDLSVQQVLEEAIQKFSGETVGLHVAGRTDAGVHARAQVAHFDLEKETTTDTVRDAINFYAKPHRAVVLKAEQVSDEFHARFSALNRRYQYQVLNRRALPALQADYVWHVPKPLEIAPMQEAANLLIGQHDFSTFRAHNCQSNSPIKTMDQITIEQIGEMIYFNTQARSFLYHQVRNMVGTLVMVGNGQWSVNDFKDAFDAKDRTKGGPTAPPQGLFFCGVTYPS